jgi:hypothetical protein
LVTAYRDGRALSARSGEGGNGRGRCYASDDRAAVSLSRRALEVGVFDDGAHALRVGLAERHIIAPGEAIYAELAEEAAAEIVESVRQVATREVAFACGVDALPQSSPKCA